MGWDWSDVASLPAQHRQSALARLVEDEDRDSRYGRRPDPERAATIKALRKALDKPATTPTITQAARKRRRAPYRSGVDIGDLYEPGLTGLERGDERVVLIIDVIELVNGWIEEDADGNRHRRGFAHHRQIDACEKRWTELAVKAVHDAALTPVPGGAAHIFVWHLKDRTRLGALPDTDSAVHPIKGALDGLVRAGLLPDDKPGHARTMPLIEPVWSSHTGLVFHLVPARGLPPFPLWTTPFPLVTVPDHG